MTTMEERVSRLEGAYEQLDQRLGDLTGAVRGLDAKIDSLRTDMDARFAASRGDVDSFRSHVDARFDALHRDVSAKFNTLIVYMSTVAIAMAGAIFALALRI